MSTTALASLPAAREHVDRLVRRYGDRTTDLEAWAASVAAHLVPLPADRAWRRLQARRGTTVVAQLMPPVVRHLSPPAGTRPQPVCPDVGRARHDERPEDQA